MTLINRPRTIGSVLMSKWAVKKILIIFICILGLLGIMFYPNFSVLTPTASVKFMPSSRSLLSCFSNSRYSSISPEIACDHCRLSAQESDEWFCEFDHEWQRRKHVHYVQDQQNHFSDERKFFFLNNWHPTIHCEFEQRIGFGDGGKWICDLHKLQSIKSTPPLVYSFGSNGDFRFENATKQALPTSEIHTFDQNIFVCPANMCVFHQVYLGDGGRDGSKSLQMIVDDLNHRGRDIDILKVDIEGSEFQLFSEFFKPVKVDRNTAQPHTPKVLPYIRQILVEIHLQPGTGKNESRTAHTLFETFRHNNYAIFHKEANINGCQDVFEYAFIRLNPTFFISSR